MNIHLIYLKILSTAIFSCLGYSHCWKGTILRHAELFENVLQAIARPLKFAHSRIINFNLILPTCKTQLESRENYTFSINFAFGKLIHSASISRQLESEQNIIFYPNLAQYIMYHSATLQNKRRIFHFARCRMFLFALILNRFC